MRCSPKINHRRATIAPRVLLLTSLVFVFGLATVALLQQQGGLSISANVSSSGFSSIGDGDTTNSPSPSQSSGSPAASSSSSNSTSPSSTSSTGSTPSSNPSQQPSSVITGSTNPSGVISTPQPSPSKKPTSTASPKLRTSPSPSTTSSPSAVSGTPTPLPSGMIVSPPLSLVGELSSDSDQNLAAQLIAGVLEKDYQAGFYTSQTYIQSQLKTAALIPVKPDCNPALCPLQTYRYYRKTGVLFHVIR